ncbi:hypothetical protein OAA_13800 [Vibrio cyclitrophicus 1F175]|uniref:hypothetical protein n=1 Tax=Vibrio cyclitrophicus TaxID=47951 RepID=UPI0002E45A7D|nr:hypothetical protein [Vibrio cyclitrophicus]OEF63555.1 hypothetical protein OAA_13800 [Vibrio cyclitrophicus 1F175]
MINTDSLANAIFEANKNKPVYIGMNSEGLYLSCAGNFIRTRACALRMVTAKHFEDKGLTAVLVRKGAN